MFKQGIFAKFSHISIPISLIFLLTQTFSSANGQLSSNMRQSDQFSSVNVTSDLLEHGFNNSSITQTYNNLTYFIKPSPPCTAMVLRSELEVREYHMS